MRSVLSLCTSALAVDTGCVVDEGAKDFNASTDILLYVARLCARVDNYVCFLLDHALNRHDCIAAGLREVSVAPATVAALHDGLAAMRAQLRGAFAPLLEDYLARLHEQTARDPTNEKLIDRNSRLAADLHAHKLLIYRNTRYGAWPEGQRCPGSGRDEAREDEDEALAAGAARTIIGSFVFLTTRHTWNKVGHSTTRIYLHLPTYLPTYLPTCLPHDTPHLEQGVAARRPAAGARDGAVRAAADPAPPAGHLAESGAPGDPR